MNEQPKFQWSKMSQDRSEQVVIRTDSYEELIELRSKAIGLIPNTKAFPNDHGQTAISEAQTVAEFPVCPTHNKAMRQGKFGYFCPTPIGKDPEGKTLFCKYKSNGTIASK